MILSGLLTLKSWYQNGNRLISFATSSLLYHFIDQVHRTTAFGFESNWHMSSSETGQCDEVPIQSPLYSVRASLSFYILLACGTL